MNRNTAILWLWGNSELGYHIDADGEGLLCEDMERILKSQIQDYDDAIAELMTC